MYKSQRQSGRNLTTNTFQNVPQMPVNHTRPQNHDKKNGQTNKHVFQPCAVTTAIVNIDNYMIYQEAKDSSYDPVSLCTSFLSLDDHLSRFKLQQSSVNGSKASFPASYIPQLLATLVLPDQSDVVIPIEVLGLLNDKVKVDTYTGAKSDHSKTMWLANRQLHSNAVNIMSAVMLLAYHHSIMIMYIHRKVSSEQAIMKLKHCSSLASHIKNRAIQDVVYHLQDVCMRDLSILQYIEQKNNSADVKLFYEEYEALKADISSVMQQGVNGFSRIINIHTLLLKCTSIKVGDLLNERVAFAMTNEFFTGVQTQLKRLLLQVYAVFGFYNGQCLEYTSGGLRGIKIRNQALTCSLSWYMPKNTWNGSAATNFWMGSSRTTTPSLTVTSREIFMKSVFDEMQFRPLHNGQVNASNRKQSFMDKDQKYILSVEKVSAQSSQVLIKEVGMSNSNRQALQNPSPDPFKRKYVNAAPRINTRLVQRQRDNAEMQQHDRGI